MTANCCCGFPVLGITAGWLGDPRHLRVGFNRLVVCQRDSFATFFFFYLNFLSHLQSLRVFGSLLAFVCAQRDVYLQAGASLVSLVRR